jgi:hypothetical protein
VATALLKRLGPLPVAAGPDRSDAMTRLAVTYDAVTQAALALAFAPGTA